MEKHFTASALVFNSAGHILLLKHKKLGVWLDPGGHIESDETPDDAIVREVKEETGLDVEIISEIDTNLSDPINDITPLAKPYTILSELISKGDESHYHIDLFYICKIVGGETLSAGEGESVEVGFFSEKEIGELELFPNFRKLLEKVFLERG
ncbi:MAG: NUDIX domain-containing protein [bacterium]